MRCSRWARSAASRSACLRSAASSPCSCARRTASGPCSGAAAALLDQPSRCGAEPRLPRRGRVRTRAAPPRPAHARRLASHGLQRRLRCRAGDVLGLHRRARSRRSVDRARCARRSTRSAPPSVIWRTSPQAANSTRPDRVYRDPAKPSLTSSRRSTTHASASSRRASSSAAVDPLTSSISLSAPGAGGARSAGGESSRADRTDASPSGAPRPRPRAAPLAPSGPAPSSSAVAPSRSRTSAASRRPPSAAVSASS